MDSTDLRELLIYMITSAAGLPGEPRIYGPLRLIEASRRLALIINKEHPDAVLTEIAGIIEAGKGKNSTDTEGFCQMLQDAAEKAVDLL